MRTWFWFVLAALGIVLLLTGHGWPLLAGGAMTGVGLAMMLDALVEGGTDD